MTEPEANDWGSVFPFGFDIDEGEHELSRKAVVPEKAPHL